MKSKDTPQHQETMEKIKGKANIWYIEKLGRKICVSINKTTKW